MHECDIPGLKSRGAIKEQIKRLPALNISLLTVLRNVPVPDEYTYVTLVPKWHLVNQTILTLPLKCPVKWQPFHPPSQWTEKKHRVVQQAVKYMYSVYMCVCLHAGCLRKEAQSDSVVVRSGEFKIEKCRIGSIFEQNVHSTPMMGSYSCMQRGFPFRILAIR